MKNSTNRELLIFVAERLEELLPEVCFVGGAVNDIYITHTVTEPSRTTVDVDFIVRIATYKEYTELSEKLRAKGFKEAMDSKVICRWYLDHAIVDVMPTNEEILGFANQWYEPGMRVRETVALKDDLTINVFPAPYYLASKLEALESRGEDLRYSKDFEDIVYLFRSRPELLTEVSSSSSEVQAYIKKQLKSLVNTSIIKEAIACQFSDEEEADLSAPIILASWTSL